MLCPSCQHAVSDGAPYCPTCGRKLAAAAPSAPAPAPAPTPGPAPTTGGKMTFGGAVKSCFRQYFGFDGRASRAEYWNWFWFTFLVGFVFGFLSGVTGSEVPALVGNVASLAFFFPGLAVSCRRLHDSGHSGWNVLWALTGIGAFYVLYLLLQPTGREPNEYGPVAPAA